jgi:Ca2+-binding RTX toxin-like protein
VSRKVIQLSGQQSEYDLRMIQTDAGPMPVLIGISGRAMGEMHYLSTTEVLEFADKTIELAQTVLADSHKASNTTNNTNTTWHRQSPNELSDQATTDTNVDEQAHSSSHRSSSSNISPSNYSHAAENKIDDELRSNRENLTESSSKLDSKESQDQHTQPNSEQSGLSSGSQATPHSQTDSGGSGAADPSYSQSTSHANTQSFTPIEPKLIEGTSGADHLVGTNSNDQIDGLRNNDAGAAFFHEELIAGNGDDTLFYRGFFGDLNSNQSIQASLSGEAGNDMLDIVLDRTTNITVDGGTGINGLTLQAPDAPFSPWQPNLIQWSWIGTLSAPTLQGTYTSALHAQAGVTEANTSFQTISSGNGAPLNIVRPDALTPHDLTGTAQADFLLATDTTQEIHAGAGNDTIIAREGNIIDAGAGINSIYAYSSDVTISYAESAYAVNLSLANKIGLVFDESSNIYAVDKLMTPIQHATGSTQSDTLKGNDLDNTLRTHGGNDTLEGGAGADTFIIDLDNSISVTAIHDFNIDESDQLLINLKQWMPSSGETAFNQYQVVSDNNEVWWSGTLNQEEGSLLTVLISQDNQNIQIGHEGQLQTVVTFDQPIDHWTTADWTTTLHFDYL